MKLKQFLLIAALAMPFSSNAAFVSSINNLDIAGTLYDVTLWDSAGAESFNTLWDANNDKTVGDGSLGTAPTFWGNSSGAETAALAVMTYLGTDSWTESVNTSWDRVAVAYDFWGNGNLKAWGDSNGSLTTDSLTATTLSPSTTGAGGNSYAYLSFTEADVPAIPLPAALWLFGPALLGFMGFRRKALKTDAI